jgi:hypothetical protein
MMDKTTKVSESEVISMLSDFYQDSAFEELKRLYLTKSFPEILAIDRREMSHSAFLKWLFNMKESHGLDSFPVLQLLKILVQRDIQQDRKRHNKDYIGRTCTENISVAIMNEDVIFGDMAVSLERPAKAENAKGRIDILIDADIFVSGKKKELHIVIENKVYSSEHSNQTGTYFKSHESRILNNRNALYFFVYLTPLSSRNIDNLTEPQCSNKEFIQINYQDILDYILEPALNKDISSRNKFVIEEYIHCLGLPAVNISSPNSNYNPNTIMATSKKTTELLKTFWTKNEPLLMAALNTLVDTSNDVDIEEKLKPAIDALEVNKRREKDKTHYEFDGQAANGKYALLKIVIPQIIKNRDVSAFSKEFKESLESLKQDTVSAYNTISSFLKKNNVDMTCPSPEELYDPKKICKTPIAFDESAYQTWWSGQGKKKELYNKEGNIRIMNQWGYDTIDYFVYAFYSNRKKWGLEDKEIKVIKQLSE